MILTFSLIGVLVGLLSGLLGIGGGIILVPCLNYYFQNYLHLPLDLSMHKAVTDSLAVVIFTSIMTASLYYRQAKISWRVVWNFIPGLVTGGLLGFVIKQNLHGSIYAQIFSLFLMFIGIKLWFSTKLAASDKKTKAKIDIKFIAISIATGMLSAIFGIGGGIIMTPFFLHLGLDMLKAIGSSSACCIPVALINSAITTWWQIKHPQIEGHLLNWEAVIYISLFSVSLAPVGARFAKILPPKVLKKSFAALLLLISLELFWNTL
jgi:uncharacterized membrane protein YfcA